MTVPRRSASARPMWMSYVCAAALALAAVGSAGQGAAQTLPTAESPPLAARINDPIWDRADALVKQMTEAEKLQMVHGYFPPFADRTPGAPVEDMIPSAGYVTGVPRLGIPNLRESDASLGVANQVNQRPGDTATALPSGLALAASFDPQLAYRGGAMIGAEARAKTFNVLLAGGVNLTRDPWAGRNFEYLGEDPWLAGLMAAEQIRGVQSNHILSTIKHFSLNPQETGRHIIDGRIGEAAHRESDLLAFEIAIERSHPASVMCAYNKVNGDWACENDHLLNQVLKREWNYPGFVMSDWGAVHSTVKAANAGMDQQSGQELDRQIYFGDDLRAAIDAGEVKQARLDDMVRRILYGIVQTGLIDNPTPTTEQPIDYAAHADVAQSVAEAGIVLLKNQRNLLPLAATAKTIAVIGGRADYGVMSGGGSSQVRSVGGVQEFTLGGGESSGFVRMTWHNSSPLEAIRAAAPNAEVVYLDGKDLAAAARAAAEADIAVVFAWHWQTEAEDSETLDLPDNQDDLIAAVAAANARSVVVLETGGPVLMPWLNKVNAVVQAWYSGQRGGPAIANVLFGKVNPSGRLPMTFPASADQAPRPLVPGIQEQKAVEAARHDQRPAPAFDSWEQPYVEGAAVGYRWYAQQGHRPLFPFGYGLTYTDFRYSNLRIEDGDRLTVSFDVTNTGRRAGADVPQVYLTAGQAQPMLRLIGFDKVELQPGQTRRVSVTAEPRVIANFDEAQPGWRITAGAYPVYVGRHAGDQVLKGSARLNAWTRQP